MHDYLVTGSFNQTHNRLGDPFLEVTQLTHESGKKFQVAGTNKKGKYVIGYWDNGVVTEGNTFDNAIISVTKLN